MKKFLCTTAEVPPGATLAVELVDGRLLAVCNVDGQFHVLDDTCTHGKASLAEGRLLGCEIECPLHAGRFDVRSGRATRRPAKRPIVVYEHVVEDGELFLVPSPGEAGTERPTGQQVSSAPTAYTATGGRY